MLCLVILQESQGSGNADSVVRPQRGSGSIEIISFLPGDQGILVEIVAYISVFFIYHVHVALQDHRIIFFALGRSLFNQDVTSRVGYCFQSFFPGKIQDVLTDGTFIFGTAGDGQYPVKMFP